MEQNGTVSKSEYARHRGVSAAMITRLRKSDRLVMVGDRVDVAASDALLAKVLDQSRGGKNGKTQAAEPSEDVPNITRRRFEREDILTRHADARYKREIGELVTRDDVARAFADLVGPALRLLDTIPDRSAPRVTGDPGEQRKVHALLAGELAAVRDQIADLGPAFVKKLELGVRA